MNKNLRRIVTFIMAIIMVGAFSKNAFAATYSWSATKIPGEQIGEQLVRTYLYKGPLTFKVTGMNGSCSYLAGKCVSYYPNQYYINNYAKCAMVSKLNGEHTFSMAWINGGDTNTFVYFVCSVEHNASINDLVSASGSIYY